jgi:hypothetical protein
LSETRVSSEQTDSVEAAAEKRAPAGPGGTELGSLRGGRDVASMFAHADGATRARMALQLQETCGNAVLQRLIRGSARTPPPRVLSRSPGDPFDTGGGWLEAELARRRELEASETGPGRQKTLDRIAAMTDAEARKDAPGIAFRAQDRGDPELAAAASARLLRAWLASRDSSANLASGWDTDDAVDTLLDRAERALGAGQFELGGNFLSIGMVQLVRMASATVARRPDTDTDDDMVRAIREAFLPMQRSAEIEIRTRIQRARGMIDRYGRLVTARKDAAEADRFEAMAKAVRSAERRAGPAIAEDLGDIGAEPPGRSAGGGTRRPAQASPPPRPKETPQQPVSRAPESIVNSTHPDLEGALVYYTSHPSRYGNIRSPRYGVAGTLAGAHRMANELFGRRSSVIVEDVLARDPNKNQREIRYLILALNLRLNEPDSALGEGGAIIGLRDIQMLTNPASRRYFFLAMTSGPWMFFSPPLLDYLQKIGASERQMREAGQVAPTLSAQDRRDAIFGPIDQLIAKGETQEAANALTFVGAEGFKLCDTAGKTRYITTLLRAFTFETHERTVVEIFRTLTGADELRQILAGLNRDGVLRKLHTDMESAFGSLLITVGQALGATALTAAQTRRLLSELKLFSPIPGIEVRGDGSIALTDAVAEFVTAIEQLIQTIVSAVSGIIDIILDPETFAKGIYKLCYFVVMANLASMGQQDAIRYVAKVVDAIGRQIGAAVRGLALLQENMPPGVEFVRDVERAIEWRITWEIIGMFVGVGEAVAFVDAIRSGRATAALAEMADALKVSSRAAQVAEDTSEAGKVVRRTGEAAERESGQLTKDAGKAGRAADEVTATRDVAGGARVRYRADGRRTLCINPCAELDHLALSDDVIDGALRNLTRVPGVDTKDLVETLAAFKGVDDVPVVKRMVESLSRGGDEAASAADLLDRITHLRQIENYQFKLSELAAAHARGDAILAHGPIQTPVFLEDIPWGEGTTAGQWELHSGQLAFPGRPSLSQHRLKPELQSLDFVILENERGGPARLILGRNHSGLSGGKPFVYAAGELRFSPTGELLGITRLSGHYRPALHNLERARDFLRDHNMLSPRGVGLIEAVP